MHIQRIAAKDTWPLRHKVMWPDKPTEFVILPDDSDGIHYGLYQEDLLTSVISLFSRDNKFQFRKFATDTNWQGMGFGTALLNYVIKDAQSMNAKSIWCNARMEKCGYYERFGLSKTKRQFSKAGIDYVIMEKVISTS